VRAEVNWSSKQGVIDHPAPHPITLWWGPGDPKDAGPVQGLVECRAGHRSACREDRPGTTWLGTPLK
jgi:hypothetical protein